MVGFSTIKLMRWMDACFLFCMVTNSHPLHPRSQECNFIEQIQCQRDTCRINLQITRERQGKSRATQRLPGELPILRCLTNGF
jgi:hypothetical protein